jgi:DNA-binding transcriptional LysR family regulator
VEGTVRITASEIVGSQVLPPMLSKLRQAHPGLEFELVLSNVVDNLLRRDADIAVRMVEPTQEALVVKKLGWVNVGLYAHKDYLKRAGSPSDLKDLASHSLIGFDQETPALRAMRSRIPGSGAFRFAFRADNDIAQLQALRSGFGIGFCQDNLAKRTPALKPVLANVISLKLGVWLAMHENLRSTPRCRAVFDGLAVELSAYVRHKAP